MGRQLVASSNDPTSAEVRPERRRRCSPDAKGGVYFASTSFTFVLVQPLGSAAVLGFVAVLALTIGVRVAGLDSWEGTLRPPGHYVRTVASWTGLAAFVTALIATAMSIGGAGLLSDWLVDADLSEVSFLANVPDWRGQIGQLIVGVTLLTPPSIVVCEAISAIARFHDALHQRLEAEERRRERDEFASDVHDGPLNTVVAIRDRSAEPEIRRLAADVVDELRDLQHERLDAHLARTVRQSLRRGLRHANRFGLEVDLDVDHTTLDLLLSPDVAQVVDRYAYVHIGNSAVHGATSAHLSLRVLPEGLFIVHVDDGGGYDPSLVHRRQGGLARLEQRILAIGGSFDFERQHDSTVAISCLPLDER